jgi:hypothetical protein
MWYLTTFELTQAGGYGSVMLSARDNTDQLGRPDDHLRHVAAS